MTTSYISQKLFSSNRRNVEKYLQRQMNDPFASRAREHSYRARSAFKLMEIDDKFRFLKPGICVVDVGCAPGSWSQVVAERCHLNVPTSSKESYLLGLDLQMVLPIPGADIMSLSDVTNTDVQEEMKKRLNGRTVKVVLSDMAPNPTGDSVTDHMRLINLCRMAFSLFYNPTNSNPTVKLARDGIYLCKIWDGPFRKEFIEELSQRFKTVKTIKPIACRDSSAELYLYCK